MAGKKISVVLPTKNESKTIATSIQNIREQIVKLGHQVEKILVVDDSTDRTRKIACDAGAIVINGGGKGLGSAMYKGLKAAALTDCDYIVQMDADGQSEAGELGRFLDPLLNEDADMVLGSRFLSEGLLKYKYRFKNRFGIHILVFILRSFTKQPLTDSHGGLRAMRRSVAEELEMIGTHTYVQETIIDAAEKGFRIKEISSVWHPRQEGKSRVVGSIPTYIFWTLPVLLLRSKLHLKALYSTGVLLIMTALIYFGIIWFEAGFDIKHMFTRLPSFIFISLFIMAGIQLFFFGFILQLLKEIRYEVNNRRKDWIK